MPSIKLIRDPNIPGEPLSDVISSLDVYRLVSRSRISHKSESDFRRACSCDDCGRKITKIMGFEDVIKSKMNLIGRQLGEVEVKKIMCSRVYSAADWTIRMLHFLHKKLNELYEESGFSQTPEESRSTIDACKKIMNTLVENEFESIPYQNHSFMKTCEISDAMVFSREINAGKFHYGETKVKDSSNEIFNEIERLQEEMEKTLDPINHLQKQVELVRRLPIKELQPQIEDTISEICPLDTHVDYYLKARQYMYDTLESMIRKGAEFWQLYQECPSSQGHGSNKLDQTLDSLILKAKLFEDEWELKFGSFYRNPYYRSDPKRQRTHE